MDIATWLNITNSSKLESQILAPLIEAAHDEIYLKLVEYYFFIGCFLSTGF